VSGLLRNRVGFSYARIRRNLNLTGPVSKIHEDQAAVISSLLQPAGKGYGFPDIRNAQFPTILHLQHILVFHFLNFEAKI
jgi:hypothetical protein